MCSHMHACIMWPGCTRAHVCLGVQEHAHMWVCAKNCEKGKRYKILLVCVEWVPYTLKH